jgi:hypothetical protein
MIGSLKFSQPTGGNLTGVTSLLDSLGAKRLSLLRELKGPARRQPFLYVLYAKIAHLLA